MYNIYQDHMTGAENPVQINPGTCSKNEYAEIIHVKRFECDKCNKKFSHKHTLKDHLNIHTGAKPYVCETCNVAYADRGSLTKHKNIHKEINPFVCEVCKKTFKRKTNLNSHMFTHSGNKPYSCNICHSSFGLKTNLRHHMVTHSDEKPFVCEVCEKGFKKKAILKRHMVVHTGEKAFLCEICNKSFKYVHALRDHMRIRKVVEINGIKTHVLIDSKDRIKPFVCDLCHKAFAERQSLQIHMRIHTKERLFVCEICRRTYVAKRYLMDHMRTHHLKTTRVSCKNCKAEFNDKNSLICHQYVYDEKEFTCKVCNKGYSSKCWLKIHTDLHSRKKIFCKYCPKKFLLSGFYKHMIYHKIVEKDGLKVHVPIKGVGNIFQCLICRMKLSSKTDLTKHEKTHQEFKKKVFSCNTCSKVFVKKESLKIHKCKNSFYCNDCNTGFKTEEEIIQHHCMPLVKNIHTCDICGKIFNKVRHLKMHKLGHKNNANEQAIQEKSSNDTKKVICADFVTTNYISEKRQSSYADKRQDNIICNVCNSAFSNMIVYQAHQLLHRSYNCVDQQNNVIPDIGNSCTIASIKQSEVILHHRNELLTFPLNKSLDQNASFYLSNLEQLINNVAKKPKIAPEYITVDVDPHHFVENAEYYNQPQNMANNKYHKQVQNTDIDTNLNQVQNTGIHGHHNEVNTDQKAQNTDIHEHHKQAQNTDIYINHNQVKNTSVHGYHNQAGNIDNYNRAQSTNNEYHNQLKNTDTDKHNQAQNTVKESQKNDTDKEFNKVHNTDIQVYHSQGQNIDSEELQTSSKVDDEIYNKTDTLEPQNQMESIVSILAMNLHPELLNGKEVYVCKICKKEFITKNRMLNHYIYAHSSKKQIVCEICDNVCANASGLDHTFFTKEEETFVPKMCKTDFRTKQDLEIHLCSHMSKNLLAYKVCSKALTTEQELETHLLTHRSEKNLVCELCNKEFTTIKDLDTHSLTHLYTEHYDNEISNNKELGTGHSSSSDKEAEPFVCKKCNKIFDTKGSLNLHMIDHASKSPGKSEVLEPATIESKQIPITCISSHIEEKPFACKICNKLFDSKGILNLHMIDHALDTPGTREDVKEPTTSRLEQITVTCTSLHKEEKLFDSKASLNLHMIDHALQTTATGAVLEKPTIDSEQMPITCEICKRTFDRSSDYYLHLHTHKSLRFVCNLCNIAYNTKSALEQHRQLHSNEVPLICDICKEVYFGKKALDDHKKLHCNKKSNADCSDILNEVSTKALDNHRSLQYNTLFVCEICNQSFLLKNAFDKHKMLHGKEKSYVCEICNKPFASKVSFDTHLRTHANNSNSVLHNGEHRSIAPSPRGAYESLHNDKLPANEKLYVCEICSESFINRYTLNNHNKIHNTHLFECEICNEKFISKYVLYRHKKIHSNEKPHVCEICNKAFVIKSYLSDHMRYHNTKKTFTCDQCDASYKRRCDLNKHQLIHGCERPFVCDVCNKAFVLIDYLRDHKRYQHSNKPFACDQCEATFSKRSLLKTHLVKHGIFICKICNEKFPNTSDLQKHELTSHCTYIQ